MQSRSESFNWQQREEGKKRGKTIDISEAQSFSIISAYMFFLSVFIVTLNALQ